MKKVFLSLSVIAAVFGVVAFAGDGKVCNEAATDEQTVLVVQQVSQTVTVTEVEVIEQFVQFVNAGEVEAARALFAEEGFAAYGMNGAPKAGTSLDAWLASDIFSVNGQIEVEAVQVDGNEVTLTGSYNSDGWSGTANYLFVVEDGLISAWYLL